MKMSDTKVIFKLNQFSDLKKIQQIMQAQKGVNEVEILLSDSKIKVNIDSNKIKPMTLSKIVSKLGYQAERITTARC